MNCILIYLYIKIPPRRNDYKECYWIKLEEYSKINNSEKNYIVYNESFEEIFFSWSDYKTAFKYGEQKIIIVDIELIKMLKEWKSLDNNKLLFHNDNHILSSAQFTRLLNMAFKETNKKLSSTLLRKIYISGSEEIQNIHKFYKKAALKAYQMAHGISMQQNVYYKD